MSNKVHAISLQDSRGDITNRTLYIDNRGQTVTTDELSGTAYSSYSNEASRTWFSPDDDSNEFESIKILGNAHVALHPDLTRYLHYYSTIQTFIIWATPLSFLGTSGVILHVDFIFQQSPSYVNRKAPDGPLCSAASHLGLNCLPMSHKQDARLLQFKFFQIEAENIRFQSGPLLPVMFNDSSDLTMSEV